MNCAEASKLMDAYLDGELDPLTSQAVERHLQECAKCAQAYAADGSLMRAIGQATPYYKAPAELRERIQSALRAEISQTASPVSVPGSQLLSRKTQPELRNIFPGTPWNWLALAAAVVLGALIASTLLPGLQRRGDDQFLATQLIASHVRSLMANHLTDVTSTDQHTVKPWLDTKLDFAPAVVDLSNQGFPLLGGRLDYLDRRPVAALIYQRRQHFINLFVWPVEPDTSKATKTISRQGYQLLHWVDSDFTYWAVSDVNAADLQSFKELFEKQVPHR